jgi:drug/metabolite transporter (DMT)-like permease
VSLKHAIQLIVLAAIWGASFLFMRVSVQEFGPVLLMTLRIGIGALVLIPFLILKKRLHVVSDNWKPILLVGLTNSAIPFSLFGYTTLYAEAGYASILNATAPMFAAIIAYFWLSERLKKLAGLGLLIGFAGVFFLMIDKMSGDVRTPLLASFAALLATFLYGVATSVNKRFLGGVDVLAVAAGSLFFAALSLIPFALMSIPAQMPSANAWISVTILGVICTGVAYLIFFNLLDKVGMTKTLSVTYMIPVFGIFWGALLLDEKLSFNLLIGGSLVLLGVGLTTGVIKQKSSEAKTSEA